MPKEGCYCSCSGEEDDDDISEDLDAAMRSLQALTSKVRIPTHS
jgi:hypothetical protein